jgi:hypothetical protein
MEPLHEHEPPMELPQPQEAPGQQPEAAPASPEIRGNQTPVAAPTAQPAIPAIQTQLVAADPVSSPLATTAASNLIADDADLIEKEWVTKAKTIVMQTKDDPFTQNKEMTKVKADYVKKRYNKDLKMSET